MSINLIAAVDRNMLIGSNNTLPWHIPADLAYFKDKTVGKFVVMGMKTFESLNKKALPNRSSVVMSYSNRYETEPETDRVMFINDIDYVFALSAYHDVWIIGGQQIFSLFIPFADAIYLTEIDHEFDGDTFFPSIDKDIWNKWKLTSSDPRLRDDKNPYNYSFNIYTKS